VIERFADIAAGLGMATDAVDPIRLDLQQRLAADRTDEGLFTDTLKAAGEANCAHLVADYLRQMGAEAHYVDPGEAGRYAAVVASGRSDYPNQINNVLAFPGVFRGLLDARAHEVSIDMLLRAAAAIAHVVKDEELNSSFIIPTVFHPDVPGAVAAAIREGTAQDGAASRPAADAPGAGPA